MRCVWSGEIEVGCRRCARGWSLDYVFLFDLVVFRCRSGFR